MINTCGWNKEKWRQNKNSEEKGEEVIYSTTTWIREKIFFLLMRIFRFCVYILIVQWIIYIYMYACFARGEECVWRVWERRRSHATPRVYFTLCNTSFSLFFSFSLRHTHVPLHINQRKTYNCHNIALHFFIFLPIPRFSLPLFWPSSLVYASIRSQSSLLPFLYSQKWFLGSEWKIDVSIKTGHEKLF